MNKKELPLNNRICSIPPTQEVFMATTLRKKQGGINNYPTKEERNDIIPNMGEATYVLYSYYLTRQRNKPFTDEAAHVYFPYWSTSKIKRCRLKLIKGGYFKQETWPGSPTRAKLTITTLGKKGEK